MQRLAEYGEALCESLSDDTSISDETYYNILTVCTDLQRKFSKSFYRGQESKISVGEHQIYNEIRVTNTPMDFNKQKVLKYLSLFKTKSSRVEEQALDARLEL